MNKHTEQEKLAKYQDLSEKQLLTLIAIELENILSELRNMHTRDELDFTLGILQKEIQVLQKGVYIHGGRVKVQNDVDEGQREPLYVREI